MQAAWDTRLHSFVNCDFLKCAAAVGHIFVVQIDMVNNAFTSHVLQPVHSRCNIETSAHRRERNRQQVKYRKICLLQQSKVAHLEDEARV